MKQVKLTQFFMSLTDFKVLQIRSSRPVGCSCPQMYHRAYVMCAPTCSLRSFSLLTEWRKHRREPLMEREPQGKWPPAALTPTPHRLPTRCRSHSSAHSSFWVSNFNFYFNFNFWVILKFYSSTLLWPKSNKKEQHLLVRPAAPLPACGRLDGSIRNHETVRSWGSGGKEAKQRAYIILSLESLLGMTLRQSFA